MSKDPLGSMLGWVVGNQIPLAERRETRMVRAAHSSPPWSYPKPQSVTSARRSDCTENPCSPNLRKRHFGELSCSVVIHQWIHPLFFYNRLVQHPIRSSPIDGFTRLVPTVTFVYQGASGCGLLCDICSTELPFAAYCVTFV